MKYMNSVFLRRKSFKGHWYLQAVCKMRGKQETVTLPAEITLADQFDAPEDPEQVMQLLRESRSWCLRGAYELYFGDGRKAERTRARIKKAKHKHIRLNSFCNWYRDRHKLPMRAPDFSWSLHMLTREEIAQMHVRDFTPTNYMTLADDKVPGQFLGFFGEYLQPMFRTHGRMMGHKWGWTFSTVWDQYLSVQHIVAVNEWEEKPVTALPKHLQSYSYKFTRTPTTKEKLESLRKGASSAGR